MKSFERVSYEIASSVNPDHSKDKFSHIETPYDDDLLWKTMGSSNSPCTDRSVSSISIG